jgi:hypothetical protein
VQVRVLPCAPVNQRVGEPGRPCLPWKQEIGGSNPPTLTICPRSSADESGRLLSGGSGVRFTPRAPNTEPLRLAGRAPGFELGGLGSNPRGAATFATARNSSVVERGSCGCRDAASPADINSVRQNLRGFGRAPDLSAFSWRSASACASLGTLQQTKRPQKRWPHPGGTMQ